MWTSVRGAKLHSMESTHTGRIPIVLVPGLAMSGRYFLPLARLLAEHHPVRVLELPGFGRSTGPDRALPMREHAAWLGEWMQARGMGACHIVAHSMGCQVAAHFAATRAARAETLTLIGPTIDIHARKRTTQILRLIGDLAQERFEVLRWALVDVLRAGLVHTWRTSTEMLSDPIEAQLAQVTAPTLLLRGKNDSIAPENWLRTAAESLPMGRWQTLPASGHCVQFSEPAQTASAILAWIGQHAANAIAPPLS